MKTTSAVVCIRCSKPTSGGIYIVDGTSTRGPYCPTCAQIVIFPHRKTRSFRAGI
ncbi:MAG: hypothetical protein M0P37_10460 [Synergistaceae bacterium]|nr:hypothetical protein [Synergistaceae bacterium]